jgi:cell division protein FtsB
MNPVSEYHSLSYINYQARVLEDPVAQELELELEHAQRARGLHDEMQSLLDEISSLESHIDRLQEELDYCEDELARAQSELTEFDLHAPVQHTPDHHSLRLFD